MVDQLSFGYAVLFMQHNRRCHFFAQSRVRATKCNRRSHGRMTQQNFVHFMRRNILAATNDDLLDAAGDVKEPLGVEMTEVSGPSTGFR